MTKIREGLEALATAVEILENQKAPKPEILDRELSGNKIHGGKITKFSSVGIEDTARQTVLRVSDNGISVDVVDTGVISRPLTVKGELTVEGKISATSLHVDEITADVRQERTSPLEFKGNEGPAYGKGLIWTGGSYTKQLVLQAKPDRLYSTESLDLPKERSYMISGNTVISETSLGESVIESNLRKVGTLKGLNVQGNFVIDQYLFWDSGSNRLGIGTESPNGTISLMNFEHEFVIDETDDFKWKLGTYTTSELQIITDDTVRIIVGPTGDIELKNKVHVSGKFGVNVKNFQNDADITTAGPIRMMNKKFEVADNIPTNGSYVVGDIVYNSKPRPSGYVGWICVRDGTPGEWKPFGQIAS